MSVQISKFGSVIPKTLVVDSNLMQEIGSRKKADIEISKMITNLHTVDNNVSIDINDIEQKINGLASMQLDIKALEQKINGITSGSSAPVSSPDLVQFAITIRQELSDAIASEVVLRVNGDQAVDNKYARVTNFDIPSLHNDFEQLAGTLRQELSDAIASEVVLRAGGDQAVDNKYASIANYVIPSLQNDFEQLAGTLRQELSDAIASEVVLRAGGDQAVDNKYASIANYVIPSLQNDFEQLAGTLRQEISNGDQAVVNKYAEVLTYYIPTLTNNLNNEALTRMYNDADLDDRLTGLINTEINDRKLADIKLQTNITGVSNDLNYFVDSRCIIGSDDITINVTDSLVLLDSRPKKLVSLQAPGISTEANRALLAESKLQTNINNEANRALLAEAKLQTNINNVTSGISTEANQALDDKIDQAISDYKLADTSLQTNITGVSNDLNYFVDWRCLIGSDDVKFTVTDSLVLLDGRPKKLVSLQAPGISTEANRALLAESKLQTNINNEASTRSQAVNLIDLQISNINVEISNMIQMENASLTEQKSADATLQTNINNEASTRSTNDIALGMRITYETKYRENGDWTLQQNLDTEITDRKSADTTLQGNIDMETGARKAGNSILQNNINNEATARSDSDTKLDDRITTIINGLDTPLIPNDITGIQGITVTQVDMSLPLGGTRKTIRISAPSILQEIIIEGQILAPDFNWIDDMKGMSRFKLVKHVSLAVLEIRDVYMKCYQSDGVLSLMTLPAQFIPSLPSFNYCYLHIKRGNTIARDSLMKFDLSPTKVWIRYPSGADFLGAEVYFDYISLTYII